MVAEWTTVSPASASATLWFQWIFQHQLVAIVAILVALFPRALGDLLSRPGRGPLRSALRLGLLVAGLSLATWVPPIVAAGGAGGFVNELFGVWGLPSGWGAVPPVFAPGVALYARWVFQYLLLGGFAVALSLDPTKTMSPILWTMGRPQSSPVSGETTTAPVLTPSRTPSIPPPSRARQDASTAARGVHDP
jgi:hypothetical protein